MNSYNDVSTETDNDSEASILPKTTETETTFSKETPSSVDSARDTNTAVTNEKTNKHQKWRLMESIILWASWIAMVAFNGYAEVFQFNGTTTSKVARSANVWFMPDGYAFSIWGLIYIGLAAWLVRYCMAGPSRKKLGFLPISLSGLLFIITCVLNISWLIFWHMQSFIISFFIILALTTLTWLLYIIVRHDTSQQDTSAVVQLLDWPPLSLYGSWLTVATFLNAFYTIEVLSNGIADVIQVFAVIILVGLLLIIAFLMEQKARDWVFGLVIFWAALAIGFQVLQRNTVIGVIIIAMAAIGDLLIYFPWDKFKLVRR